MRGNKKRGEEMRGEKGSRGEEEMKEEGKNEGEEKRGN